MKTKVAWKAVEATILYKFLANQLPKIAAKQYRSAVKEIRNIDYVPALHRVGLTPYRPMRSTAGGVTLFILGCIAGGMAALALTPMKGEELRTQVKDRAKALIPQVTKESEIHSPSTAQA